ncbi:WxL protein host-binding domain-containing protein [Vagococcus fluvialis]|uniref:WxL protein host-binding domain-containing protein n=1 Tax=Vagococcus fluvialis TaxID=2738 RepID=UPI0037CFD4B0
MEELITLSDKEVSLAPSEKKEVTLTVKMPKNEFSGTLASALYVIEIPQSEATNTIRNILSREIAILLSNSTKEITPNIIFNDAKAIHNNERNPIEINMENVTATYIKNVTLAYDIKHKEQIFMNGEQNSIKIATNSLISFVIPMNDKEFLAGDYSAQIKVESDNNVWNETLQFSVKKEEANKLNNLNVASEEEKSLPWSTIILSLVLITFIGLVFYLIWKSKQLKQKIKKKKKTLIQ